MKTCPPAPPACQSEGAALHQATSASSCSSNQESGASLSATETWFRVHSVHATHYRDTVTSFRVHSVHATHCRDTETSFRVHSVHATHCMDTVTSFRVHSVHATHCRDTETSFRVHGVHATQCRDTETSCKVYGVYWTNYSKVNNETMTISTKKILVQKSIIHGCINLMVIYIENIWARFVRGSDRGYWELDY